MDIVYANTFEKEIIYGKNIEEFFKNRLVQVHLGLFIWWKIFFNNKKYSPLLNKMIIILY